MVAGRFPWVTFLQNDANVGFASAANQGLRSSSGRHMLLLNPDMLVPPGAIAGALDGARATPRCGDARREARAARRYVRPRMQAWLPDDPLRPRVLPPSRPDLAQERSASRGTRRASSRRTRPAPSTPSTAPSCSIRREAAESVGPIDERYWMYAEDLDWCHRFWKRGWKVLYWPGAEVIHWKGGSSGDVRSWPLNRAFHRSMWLFYEKHHAPRHPKALSYPVWAGVWAKLGVSALGNVLRRPPTHDWGRRGPSTSQPRSSRTHDSNSMTDAPDRGRRPAGRAPGLHLLSRAALPRREHVISATHR